LEAIMRARVLAPVVLVASLVASVFPAAVIAQHDPEELLIGTWVLDVNASRYRPGPAPRGETRVYARSADGISGVVKRTQADGTVQTIEYLANTDREQMVTGTPEYDAVKLRQIDPFTSEALLTHGGSVFGAATRVIARNGQSMTITFRRPDADVLNVAVYRKRP
jgi:hypothetical protein